MIRKNQRFSFLELLVNLEACVQGFTSGNKVKPALFWVVWFLCIFCRRSLNTAAKSQMISFWGLFQVASFSVTFWSQHFLHWIPLWCKQWQHLSPRFPPDLSRLPTSIINLPTAYNSQLQPKYSRAQAYKRLVKVGDCVKVVSNLILTQATWFHTFHPMVMTCPIWNDFLIVKNLN